MWGCGCRVCPQVCKTLKKPISAPRCFGAGVEQELKEHFLVLPDERNQRVWHAEDQVVIVGRQQLLLASGQPLVTSVGLALGAMAIAARVVRDGPMAAAFTLVAVSTECGRAAALDGSEHFQLWPRKELPTAIQESIAGPADDVSHLPGWSLHGLSISGDAEWPWNSRSVIWSSGLAAALRWRRDKCRYSAVSLRCRCPSSNWMVRKSAPASSLLVAKLWRSVCGPIRLPMPARRAAS